MPREDQLKSEQGKLLQYGAVKDVEKSLEEYIQKQKDNAPENLTHENHMEIIK